MFIHVSVHRWPNQIPDIKHWDSRNKVGGTPEGRFSAWRKHIFTNLNFESCLILLNNLNEFFLDSKCYEYFKLM